MTHGDSSKPGWGLFTPWSTVRPFIQADAYPTWVSEEDAERLASYQKFEEIYWSDPRSFELSRRGDDDSPIYVPNGRKVVDVTSHFYLKGLKILPENGDEKSPFGQWLSDFLKREQFYSRFIVGKHSGVARGDYLFHITGDRTKPTGRRISVTSLDPGIYFPVFDPDDVTKKVGCRLVEQWRDERDPEHVTRVKILKYWYEIVDRVRRVAREEAIWKMEGWNNPDKAEKIKDVIPASLLPSSITTIPVYHYKNLEWQGQDFGSSELRGFERLMQGVNQVVSDLELALALDGLGVYATDAGRPINSEGQEEDWEVAPGRVLEVPGATMFKRVEGVSSSTPALDFARYLEEAVYEASSTSQVALGKVDVNVAESGIALAIQFVPTLAKLEQRDQAGVDVTQHMFFDLNFWFKAYEGENFVDQEVAVTLGDKLPENRPKTVEELNNMVDRNVISREFYREQMKRFGYRFPKNIEKQIQDELKMIREAMTPEQLAVDPEEEEGVPGPGGRLKKAGDTLPKDSKSNNRGRPNESAGTEIKR